MKYPKVNISTDITGTLDANYICFLAKGISMGEYQNNGFLVLPYLDTNNPKSVFFPDLPYSKDFWKYITNNTNKNLSDSFPKKAVEEVKELLSNVNKEAVNEKLNKLQKEWIKIEKSFFSDVSNFLKFEKAMFKVDEVNILLTPYGTVGSFNPPRIGNGFKLFATSRVDMCVGNIAAGILQNLFIIDTHIGGEINTDNYLKRMSVISFIFKNTVFSKYYTDFKDLLESNYNISIKANNDSEKFLRKLGFQAKEVSINLNDTNFTKQELKALNNLIKNKGSVVTFDNLAETVWEEEVDDKFSLEALAKIIENLRRKIRNQGINKEVIFTKRGSGYIIQI